jgi:nucleotide-binding universal stress UspA family protein
MYRNILVPIDGSDTASRGLEEAIRLAKALGSQIRLVHVVNEWRGSLRTWSGLTCGASSRINAATGRSS